MGHCKICCADQMIVGRWYKLITYAVGYDVPYNYTVNYSTSSGNITLLHDTLYIKEVGEFTVSCVDMYGNSDTKTITAIEKPAIERAEYTINPTDWLDFQMKVTEIGSNALIHVSKGEYAFELTNMPYTLPSGTVIDFQNSIINITSEVTTYTGFRIVHDHCGIKNASFVGNMLNDKTYVNTSTVVSIISGDFVDIENLTFDSLAGFNLTVGAWPSFWHFKPTHKASRWSASDNVNGYIGVDGNVVSTTEAWTMGSAVAVVDTPDRSYYVGHSNMWMPSVVRLYDIAFYDSDMNFLELHKDQQYFRKYYYPENAAYVRYCVWQESAPVDHSGRDDVCIMRMMAGNAEYQQCLSVRETWISNIVYKNHASGGISIVGQCEDIHIDRMLAKGNGWSNGWAFDAEDGWNSMLGIVVSHSYFAQGSIILHGCQGVSFISCIEGRVTLNSNVHFPTLINTLNGTIYSYGTRGCATIINSYINRIEDTEGNGTVYEFGSRTLAENSDMRNSIAWYI